MNVISAAELLSMFLKVYTLSPTGQLDEVVTRHINKPSYIELDSRANLVIADDANHRILVVSLDGKQKERGPWTLVSHAEDAELIRPCRVAVRVDGQGDKQIDRVFVGLHNGQLLAYTCRPRSSSIEGVSRKFHCWLS